MGLRADIVGIPLEQRFTYDQLQNVFFVNLKRFSLHSRDDIETIEKMVEAKLEPVGERVYAIVNCDNFSILPELLDEYTAMVRSTASILASRAIRRADFCA